MIGGRADERDIMLADDTREVRIFGHEPVTGVNGLRAGQLTCGDECRDIQIAVACFGRTDAYAFVGKSNMHGIRVCRRVCGDRRDAHLMARALYSERDLASVCD